MSKLGFRTLEDIEIYFSPEKLKSVTYEQDYLEVKIQISTTYSNIYRTLEIFEDKRDEE